ncbi:MAG: CsgG/HfaB family protein [Gemmatimonadota bacterium]
MTRTARFVSLAAAFAGLAAPIVIAGAQASTKPTVAIMAFDNASYGFSGAKDYDGLSKGVPAMLITDMATNSSIRVIERDEVQRLVDEQKLVTGGQVDKETAIKVGKLLGAQHMIWGTFMVDPKGNFRIDAKAVNVETGAIEHVDRVDDKADNIMSSVGNLATKLNTGMKLPAMVRRTGDASPAAAPSTGASGAPASNTGTQQAGAPSTQKVPMRAVVMYGKALDLKDKGKKSDALELFGAVLKEFPGYTPAATEVASLKKGT